MNGYKVRYQTIKVNGAVGTEAQTKEFYIGNESLWIGKAMALAVINEWNRLAALGIAVTYHFVLTAFICIPFDETKLQESEQGTVFGPITIYQ